MDAAREIGCIACVVSGVITPYSVPPEYTAIHHIDGKTKPNAHLETIPLCPSHHQTGEIRIHGRRKAFEDWFGTEYDLLERTREIINRKK
jgi:hypothetical protein